MFLMQNVSRKSLRILPKQFTRCFSDAKVVTEKDKSLSINGEESLGQPTASTHPHLLRPGEIVPGVRLDEFKDRRARFMDEIQKYNIDVEPSVRNHTVIIPSAGKKYMSDKIPYVFRQNSDFFYLTGCLEPDSALVMSIDELGKTKSTLFMRPKDKQAELWDGPRTGVDNSLEMFGVDEAFPVNLFKSLIYNQIKKTSNTAVWYDEEASNQPQLTEDIKNVPPIRQIKSPTRLVQSLRLFKSPAEIDLMRKTCEIASEAINETMAETKPGHSEHHIFAMVDYKCRMKNASYLAYPPVVAAGTNATTIHYINNTQLAKSGDLVLMDAGCEYGGYSSDITRTWPVNGEFTEAQKVLYDVILLLQKDLIGFLMQEGGETLDILFETMCFRLGRYLQEVGLISKHVTQQHALARAGYGFCPHHVSHYLGMDVHDTPLMSRSVRLQPGMVCTVEPGIYIPTDRLDVPKEFRGIGIRIEDDILISSSSSVEVLTSKCIKERSDLEGFQKSK